MRSGSRRMGRTSAHNDPQRFGRIGDRLLFYSKGRTKIFKPVMGEYSPEQLRRYKGVEGTRRYKAENLTAPHFSETRTIPWRGTHPGRDRKWRFSMDELERLYADGRILLRRDGCPRKDGLKEYLDEVDGAPAQDIWTDIVVGPTSGERLGYPTQKPLKLLERIIAASSNEGDTVLDPFCGSATAIAAAHKLNRQWIGIDIAFHAIKRVAQVRLQDEYGLVEGEHYTVSGVPRTLEGAQSLWRQDKYAFQRWAIEQVNGFVTTKRTADGGIDGRLYFALPGENQMRSMVIEVKGGRNIGVNVIRSLVGVLNRDEATMAGLITMEPLSDRQRQNFMREVSHVGMLNVMGVEYPRIQMLSIPDIIARKMFLTPTVAGRGKRQGALPLIDTRPSRLL